MNEGEFYETVYRYSEGRMRVISRMMTRARGRRLKDELWVCLEGHRRFLGIASTKLRDVGRVAPSKSRPNIEHIARQIGFGNDRGIVCAMMEESRRKMAKMLTERERQFGRRDFSALCAEIAAFEAESIKRLKGYLDQ